MTNWQGLSWASDELGTALPELVRRSRPELSQLGEHSVPAPGSDDDVDSWLEAIAPSFGLRVQSVAIGIAQLEETLGQLGTACVRIDAGGPRYLAVIAGGAERLEVFTPALRTEVIAVEALRELLLERRGSATSEVEQVLDALREAQVANEPRGRVLELLEPSLRIADIWLLESDRGASFADQLRRAGSFTRTAAALALSFGQVAALTYSWSFVGQAAISGVVQGPLFLAWTLLVVSAALMGLGALLLGNRALGDANRLLKARLFCGALRVPADEVRARGAGRLLALVGESSIVGRVGLSGAFGLSVALFQLLVALFVSALGAAGIVQSLALLLWSCGMAWLARRYAQARARWSEERLGLSQGVLENVRGFRTRVAQQPATRWHLQEDHALRRYLERSAELDRLASTLAAVPARGWLLLGLLVLLPEVLSNQADTLSIALTIGGTLQGYGALSVIASQLVPLADALGAWRQVDPLFRSARQLPLPGLPGLVVLKPQEHSGADLLSVRQATFSYGAREPVLRNLDLEIQTGERVLVEGPSGGGKSTLASLLAGLRSPQSGQILLRGLDRASMGATAWRRSVVLVPQFHENHLISASLGFNLLLGSRWPASAERLKEAEELCRELALGPLLDKMPLGLEQAVGDTGWQLSHGERARIFLARALLQSPELLVLDESFAALDPETLRVCMECASKRARTVLAIAHP